MNKKKQINRQDKNNMPPIIRSLGINNNIWRLGWLHELDEGQYHGMLQSKKT